MPRYDYTCPDGHTQEKVVSIKDTAPAYIRCGRIHLVPDGHPDRDKPCGKRAKKQTVYRFGVGGDLPTRGAF